MSIGRSTAELRPCRVFDYRTPIPNTHSCFRGRRAQTGIFVCVSGPSEPDPRAIAPLGKIGWRGNAFYERILRAAFASFTKGLTTIGAAARVYKQKGVEKRDIRYFISSLRRNGERSSPPATCGERVSHFGIIGTSAGRTPCPYDGRCRRAATPPHKYK